MSILNVGLLIALIAIFIWIKWDDKHKWETVYEAQGHRSKEIQQRFHYLRGKGIHCRLKNYAPGTFGMMGRGGGQISTLSTLQLQVHKKESDRAFHYLADFNK